MLRGDDDKAVSSKISEFLDPSRTSVHGRPIYPDTAKECGLNISIIDLMADLWKHIWSLYVRLNYITSNSLVKIVESADSSYVVGRGKGA